MTSRIVRVFFCFFSPVPGSRFLSVLACVTIEDGLDRHTPYAFRLPLVLSFLGPVFFPPPFRRGECTRNLSWRCIMMLHSGALAGEGDDFGADSV